VGAAPVSKLLLFIVIVVVLVLDLDWPWKEEQWWRWRGLVVSSRGLRCGLEQV
jgi:hypothetical protein